MTPDERADHNTNLTRYAVTAALCAAIGSYVIDNPHAGSCFLLAAVGVWFFNREA